MDQTEFFSGFKSIKICFYKESFVFENLCLLIGLKIRFSKLKITFHQLHGIGEYQMIKEHELNQINALINFSDEAGEILFSRYSEEHKALIEMKEKLNYRSFFSSQDIELIEQIEDYENLDLKYVWVLSKGRENKLIFQILLAAKFTEVYEHKNGFITKMAEKCQSNIHNIFLHIMDYIKINGFRNFKPKEKNIKQIHKNYKLKGNVVIIYDPVKKNIDPFKIYPDAKFSITYWNSGIIQIRKNDKIPIEFFDLSNIIKIVLNKYKEKWEHKIIPMSTIKWVSEAISHPFDSFSFDYFETLPVTSFYGSRKNIETFKADFTTYLLPFKKLGEDQIKLLDRVAISFWDLLPLLIEESSSMINISVIPYYGKATRPNRISSLFKTDKSYKLCKDLVFHIYRALNAV